MGRSASQYAVPTYNGLFMYDGDLKSVGKLGVYADQMPVGIVYSPVSDRFYVAWVYPVPPSRGRSWTTEAHEIPFRGLAERYSSGTS